MDVQKKKILKIIGFFIALGIFSTVNAASLYFSPSSSSLSVGQSFSVGVYVLSDDQAMNAASGLVSFPTDRLEVRSVSKSGSIIDLWIDEPSFSNGSGTVSFEGIVLNPGYTGGGGKILTINFRTKRSGASLLTFASESILANDGFGTNIFTTSGTANFNITSGVRTSSEAGAPSAPHITSSTHGDPEKWYAESVAEFSWEAPDDIVATRLLIGRKPTVTPTVVYNRALTQKTIEGLDDGTWYFHVQFKNEVGWGGVTHFKLQVDTTAPSSFDIKFVEDGKESENPTPSVYFTATDATSGVGLYKVKIDGGSAIGVGSDVSRNNPFIVPLQDFGEHTLLVEAYDKAGNKTTSSEEFTIIPLKTPEITRYSSQLGFGESLIIEGETYSNSAIVVSLLDGKGDELSQEVESDQKGTFSLVWEGKIKGGIYTFSAVVTDERGAKSRPTDPLPVSVKRLPSFEIGSTLLNYLTMAVVSIGLIMLVVLMIYYGRYKLNFVKRRLEIQAKSIDKNVNKVFELLLLRKEVKEHMVILKNTKTQRELTKEEEKILEDLVRHFEVVEKKLKKPKTRRKTRKKTTQKS